MRIFHFLHSLIRARELCYFFAWRDLKVRYKHTLFGFAWAIIRPLLTMVLFTLVFGKVAGLETSAVNYPLFVLVAMIPWQFFANMCNDATVSLTNHAAIIHKIYFPRVTLPLSRIAINLFDFGICYTLFLMGLLLSSTALSPLILLTPLIVLLTIFLSVGVALWCSALTVRFRDFTFIVNLMTQFGVFISPVGYSSSLVPSPWNKIYALNPLVGIIDLFRYVTLGIESPLLAYELMVSIAITTFLLVTGVLYFQKTERILTDIL